MSSNDRVKRIAAGYAAVSCLLLTPIVSPFAATLRWTGAGASALWSDADNWTVSRAPLDADDLEFGGAVPRFQSVLDLSRTFGSMAFTTDSGAFSLHVQGSGARLAFDGAGIRNLTAGTGPIRQDLFADAGVAGGSIVFTKSSGINLDSSGNFRPVNITAAGGAASGAVGGHIVFQDNAATSGNSFDALRAEGASAAGATGGEIIFRNNAIATKTSAVTVTGGTSVGAVGGRASFGDLARADGTLNVLAGSGGGLGGRLTFAGQASASVFVGFMNQGATASGADAQAITTFRDDAKLIGSANNQAGQGAGFNGGRLEFRDRASHDTTGVDASLGLVQIINGGSASAGAGGGSTVFFDDALVRGTRLLITNAVQGEGAEAGSFGGSTEFRNRSLAGQVALVNEGATIAGATGGASFFRDHASAQNASITSNSGSAASALGGAVVFADQSTAAGASLINQGGRVAGAFGGTADFSGTASAGSATIVNAAGEVTGTAGGATRFSGHAAAGTAFIANNAALGVGGGQGGSTAFSGDASAERASLDNQGGLFTSDNATTVFRDRATAGSARITNFGGRAVGAFGGGTSFDGTALAGSASIVMAGGGVADALGGFTVFRADASAGTATLGARGATVLGASGGRVFFDDRATAGSAQFTVEGSGIDNVLGPEAASVSFAGTSSAADARFAVGGNSFAGGGSGALRFGGASTAARAAITLGTGQTRGGLLEFAGADATQIASAGDAIITNQGGSSGAARGLAIGGQTSFMANSTAARASITNGAGSGAGLTNFFATSGAGDAVITNAGGLANESGGATQFNNNSSAERAIIVNQAGARGASGFDAAGSTRFLDSASAGSAHITAKGATSGSDIGGLVSFQGSASPGNATLTAEAGTGAGAGGRIRFAGFTNANTARVVLGAGTSLANAGTLDISGLATALPGVAIGSLEGGGSVDLGGKNLTVWGPGARTSFSGLVRDDGTGGSLAVRGGATLTLTGSNTYSGATRIGDGANANSGKLVVANTSGSATGSGAVSIERGGTLAGSGSVGGPVSLLAGGTIAPGDPVTLTLRDTLTWDGGGIVRLVLGADSAGSDHLVVHTLKRGADGPYVIDLVDFGIVAGASYDLIHFDSLVGFDSRDFTFSGATGSFALANGSLEFTAAAVPEPATAAMAMLGLLVIIGAAKRRQRQPGDAPCVPVYTA